MMMMTMTMTMTMMMNIISVYIIVKIQKQCICTADLADVAAKHDVNLHSFADDTQLSVMLQKLIVSILQKKFCYSNFQRFPCDSFSDHQIRQISI